MISPHNSAKKKKAPLLFSQGRLSCIPVLPLSFMQTKQYYWLGGGGMNREENQDPFSFCPFCLSATLDARAWVIYWGTKEGEATWHVPGVTGIASERCVVLPLNRRYLNAKFVRKTNPKYMCHFGFSLRYPASGSVSQMPWKVQCGGAWVHQSLSVCL